MLHIVAALLAPFASFGLLLWLARPVLEALRARIGPDRMLPASAFAGTLLFSIASLGGGVLTALLPTLYGVELVLGASAAFTVAVALQFSRLVLQAQSEAGKTFRIEAGAAHRLSPSPSSSPSTRPLHVVAVRDNVGYSSTSPASGYCVYTLELELADGTRLENAYVDKASFERDSAAIVERGAYREPALRREGIVPPSTSATAPQPASGLVLLTLPILVIATVAAFARLSDRTPVRARPPKLRAAEVGGMTVYMAAILYRNLPDTASAACPTLADLVAAKRLSRAETVDPWDTPYELRCEGDDVHVRSAGADRVFDTPDDVIAQKSML